MNKVFILAGTAEQAKTLARWHDMARSEWCYVSEANKLMGLRQLTLWLFGTWYERTDSEEIIALAKARDFKTFVVMQDCV